MIGSDVPTLWALPRHRSVQKVAGRRRSSPLGG